MLFKQFMIRSLLMMSGLMFFADDDSGGGGDDGGGSDDNSDKDDKSKDNISITPEHLDNLLTTRVDKNTEKLTKVHKAEMVKLNDQIEDLKKQMSTSGGDKDDKDKDADIQKRIDDIETQAKERLEVVKAELKEANDKAEATAAKIKLESEKTEITSALIELKCVNPVGTYHALKGERLIGYDDGKLVPLTASGHPVPGKAGEDLSIKEYLKQYLDDHKYLVAASGNSGSGTKGGGGADGGDKNLSVNDDVDPETHMKKALEWAKKQEAQGRTSHGGESLEDTIG